MSRPRLIRLCILPLLLSSLVAGCGPLVNLSPKDKLLTYYNLTPAESFDGHAAALPIILLVEQPVSPGDLDSARIALKPSALEVKYYGKAKWADRAPRMLQNLLVTSFENSGLIKSAGTEAMGIPADFRLKSTIRDFQADYPAPNAPPVVHVTLSFKLVRKLPSMTVSSKVISASAQAARDKLPDIMRAFDQATREVLEETVKWTLEEAAKNTTPSP